MRTREKLIYTNERGESIEFSPASSYHVNFKDVTGLSDVRNAIYSTNSMGQDGDTYLGYRIESRDIDIVGYIKERDKQAAQNSRPPPPESAPYGSPRHASPPRLHRG